MALQGDQHAVESVWDYPRPPRLEPTTQELVVLHGGVEIARSHRGLRLLETSHPPVYYLPPEDVRMDLLRPSNRRASLCEFKGRASYWSLQLPEKASPGADPLVPDVAWSYAHPAPPYTAMRDFLAFYASRVDRCLVDGETVQAQPGDFYGGWITSWLRGPFKGAPGTLGW